MSYLWYTTEVQSSLTAKFTFWAKYQVWTLFSAAVQPLVDSPVGPSLQIHDCSNQNFKFQSRLPCFSRPAHISTWSVGKYGNKKIDSQHIQSHGGAVLNAASWVWVLAAAVFVIHQGNKEMDGWKMINNVSGNLTFLRSISVAKNVKSGLRVVPTLAVSSSASSDSTFTSLRFSSGSW